MANRNYSRRFNELPFDYLLGIERREKNAFFLEFILLYYVFVHDHTRFHFKITNEFSIPFWNFRWYFRKIKRIEAEKKLLLPENEHGAFLIRDSESRHNDYSLSGMSGNSNYSQSYDNNDQVTHVPNVDFISFVQCLLVSM